MEPSKEDDKVMTPQGESFSDEKIAERVEKFAKDLGEVWKVADNSGTPDSPNGSIGSQGSQGSRKSDAKAEVKVRRDFAHWIVVLREELAEDTENIRRVVKQEHHNLMVEFEHKADARVHELESKQEHAIKELKQKHTAELATQKSDSRRKEDELRDELEKKKEESATSTNKVAKLKEALAKEKAEKAEANATIDAGQTKYESLEIEHNKIKEEASGLRADVSNLKQANESNATELQEKTGEVRRLSKENESILNLKQENQSLRDKFLILENSVRQNDRNSSSPTSPTGRAHRPGNARNLDDELGELSDFGAEHSYAPSSSSVASDAHSEEYSIEPSEAQSDTENPEESTEANTQQSGESEGEMERVQSHGDAPWSPSASKDGTDSDRTGTTTVPAMRERGVQTETPTTDKHAQTDNRGNTESGTEPDPQSYDGVDGIEQPDPQSYYGADGILVEPHAIKEWLETPRVAMRLSAVAIFVMFLCCSATWAECCKYNAWNKANDLSRAMYVNDWHYFYFALPQMHFLFEWAGLYVPEISYI